MLWKILTFCFLNLSIFNCGLAKNKDQRVFAIYGSDDRREVFQVNDPTIERLSRATAAIFVFYKVRSINADYIRITGKALKDSQNICEEERFSEQTAASYCSGVLIGKDLLLTAGHCVKLGKLACWGTKIIFDYRYSTSQQDPTIQPRSNVFSCTDILYQNSKDDLDYAILRLDRPVNNREPVDIQIKQPAVKAREGLFMIGNPFGIPQKIVSGKVRTVYGKNFTTNLDALNNNSGAPVFSTDYKLVGLLVSGEKDLIYDRSRSCNKLNRCPDDECEGESVQSVEPILEIIKKSIRQKNLIAR